MRDFEAARVDIAFDLWVSTARCKEEDLADQPCAVAILSFKRSAFPGYVMFWKGIMKVAVLGFYREMISRTRTAVSCICRDESLKSLVFFGTLNSCEVR